MKQNMISISGGCDSTAMLLMMLESDEPIIDVVFFDWGREFPQVYDHLEKLEKYTGITITRLYPKEDWATNEDKYGVPRPRGNWCTARKTDRITKHRHSLGDVMDCIGFVYEERNRRPKYKPWQRYPLLERGVCKPEALKYCQERGFDWDGLYGPGMFDRVSCWCCFNKNKREQLVMQKHFPEYWEYWKQRYLSQPEVVDGLASVVEDGK